MEYTQMRALLEEMRFSLQALFEGGLSAGERQSSGLQALLPRLRDCGLAKGCSLLEELCASLSQARVNARWEAEEASLLFAKLWRYISLCLRRLEFLEAKAQLS